MFAGSQQRKAQREAGWGAGGGFFPLFGIVLGRTPVAELERMGSHARDKDDEGNAFNYYKVNGFDIWYDDGVADSMYMTHGDALPDPWRAAGFDWDLSYDAWNALFAKLRCVVSVATPPKKVRHFSGKRDSFEAKLEAAYKGNGYAVVFKLDFSYGEGTTTRDKSTLYSINVCAD